MVICLEQGADLHMAQLTPLPLTVSCFSKIKTALPLWYWLTVGFMTRVTCTMTAKNRDQLRNPTLGNWVWATFTFFYRLIRAVLEKGPLNVCVIKIKYCDTTATTTTRGRHWNGDGEKSIGMRIAVRCCKNAAGMELGAAGIHGDGISYKNSAGMLWNLADNKNTGTSVRII